MSSLEGQCGSLNPTVEIVSARTQDGVSGSDLEEF